MRYKLEPAIWSRDTCQRIAWFDRCQLIITWCHISKNDVIYRKYIVNQGCMSLSTYYLEDGRHVARLHRRHRRARPREIPLVAITWENQFMSFLYFPIWVWGSAWRSFGPPELRYKNYAKTHGDRAGSMTRSEINRVRRQDYENVISPYFRKIPKTPWKSIVVY